MNEYILYGLGGADVQYVTIRYRILYPSMSSTEAIKSVARSMKMEYPTIETIYLISNRYGLRREYIQSIKDHHNSIEARYIFRDTLEREGIRIDI